MKRLQGKKIVGYVVVMIRGEHPTYFLQVCMDEGFIVWDVQRKSEQTLIIKVYRHQLNKLKALSETLNYEIITLKEKGFSPFLLRLIKRKSLLLSIILCSALLLLLSNITWNVTISGVSLEMENKLKDELKRHGIERGSFTFTLQPLNVIQHHMMHDLPDLLYIGIEKNGTTYHITAVEKLIEEEEQVDQAQHLIASKHGVIEKMYIEKGIPLVRVNDYVKQGDKLVSGMYENLNVNEENGEASELNSFVKSEGEVYANTWYEATVTASIEQYYEMVTGDKVTKKYFSFGKLNVLINPFIKIPFNEQHIEKETKQITLFNWKTPFKMKYKHIYNKDKMEHQRQTSEIKQQLNKHILHAFQFKLHNDIEIKNYYVLHESVDNGKVKFKLYVSVLENIAIPEKIK